MKTIFTDTIPYYPELTGEYGKLLPDWKVIDGRMKVQEKEIFLPDFLGVLRKFYNFRVKSWDLLPLETGESKYREWENRKPIPGEIELTRSENSNNGYSVFGIPTVPLEIKRMGEIGTSFNLYILIPV